MGKTLKRQRARLQKEQEQAQQQQQAQQQRAAAGPALPRVKGLPPLDRAAAASKFTAGVSSCLADRDWAGALALLTAMAVWGKLPKLGAIQRWVRDADQAGDEALTARLLDAILRTTSQPEGGSSSSNPGAAWQQPLDLQGSVVHHPPWSPLPAAGGAQPLLAGADAAGAAAAAAVDGAGADAAGTAEAGRGAATTTDAAAAQAAGRGGLPASPNTVTNNTSTQQAQQQAQQRAQAQALPDYGSLLYRVPFQLGAGGPAAIHAFPPGTLALDAQHPPVRAHPVPFVPGALLLEGVFSAAECARLLAAAEATGYSDDVDYTFAGQGPHDGDAADEPRQQQAQQQQEQQQQEQEQEQQQQQGAGASSAARAQAAGLAGLPAAAGSPAAGCVWLVDSGLLDAIMARVGHLLPQQLGGGGLAGINARWRLYRYTPGAVYRPHVDGAWPGSGVDGSGCYVFDAFGDRWSRLTFLVYLNDSFAGGATTFYTPSVGAVGVLDARGVTPRAGCVLVFPHGGARGSLVHEGSAVSAGAKHVIRTDVLYMKARGGRGGGGGDGSSGGKRQRL